MPEESSATQTMIDALQLEPHVEGGYFRRTYQSDSAPKLETQQGSRFAMSSIFYLLTESFPVGHWHLNQSDILHYFQAGSALTYYLIHSSGELEVIEMGTDVVSGQQLQLLVPGGTWKASHLTAGEFGLISEAVVPGFDYADMTLGDRQALLDQLPQHAELIQRFTKE
jgi:predicted cupin superfamily sugar epimerase